MSNYEDKPSDIVLSIIAAIGTGAVLYLFLYALALVSQHIGA